MFGMTANPDEKTTGLESRYLVERRNDTAGKHDECRYFVLDPQHDPIAEAALRVYANLASDAGYQALADDLLDWVGRCPIYGKKPHAEHTWIDVCIAGEMEVACEGVSE